MNNVKSPYYQLNSDGSCSPMAKLDYKAFDIENRRIAKDIINDIEISTVFLVYDHSFYEGKPLLFETMIFGGSRNGEQYRFSTYKEAFEFHNKLMAELSNKVIRKLDLEDL